MIDIKMLKGTGPYNQMKRYIEDVHKNLNPQQRAGKFTALLKKYVNNCNMLSPHRHVVAKDLIESFAWHRALEGRGLWSNIYRYSTAHILKVQEPRPKPVVERPQIVWPEGYTHYNPRLNQDKGAFFNSAGRIMEEGHRDWNHPDVAFEHWSKERSTIKRPENPLPRGLQWPAGYTHHNTTCFVANGGFFFNDKHWVVGNEAHLPPRNITERDYKHWVLNGDTIKRYPDNQPLVLEAPVVAPEAVAPRVEARVAPPAQAAPQAFVEAPKAAPVKHKPVGWWN